MSKNVNIKTNIIKYIFVVFFRKKLLTNNIAYSFFNKIEIERFNCLSRSLFMIKLTNKISKIVEKRKYTNGTLTFTL